jgi:hypothetical protein
MSFANYYICSVSWCQRSRHGNSQYCSNHARRNRDYGHPEGRPVTKQDLAPYLKRVKQFFRKYKDHPATLEAIKLLDQWLQEGAIIAAHHPGDRVNQELKRLYDGGLKGKEALEMMGAVWLFAYECPHRLPDDRRATYALSRALLQTRPQSIRRVSRRGDSERLIYNKPGATVHEVIGQRVRDSIGLTYVRMIEAMQREARKAQDARERLMRPFDDVG